MLRLQSAVIDTLRVFAVPLISSLADSHLLNANVERTSTVHCQRQELSVGVLRECKASAIITHLTLVPYGTDALKTAFFRVGISTPFSSGTWFLGPTGAFLYTAYRSLHLFLHSSR